MTAAQTPEERLSLWLRRAKSANIPRSKRQYERPCGSGLDGPARQVHDSGMTHQQWRAA